MKLRIVVTVLLLIALSFAACTPGKNEVTATVDTAEASAAPAASQEAAIETIQGWDFDNRFGGGQGSVVETEDAYYYTAPGGAYLYYYDKASGERGVLCGKPECVHDAEKQNTRCNGYVSIMGTLGYWDDRLHFLTYYPGENGKNFADLSVKLDGSDRRADMSTDLKIGSVYYTPQRLDYHHGKLYGWCKTETVHGGVPANETCILCMDPKTGELKKVYSVESDFHYSDPTLFYAGQYVYFYLEHFDKTDNDWITYLEIRRYNIDTEEIEDLFISREEGFLGSGTHMWVESEDLIYLMPQYYLDDNPSRLYQISDGALSVAFDFETDGIGSISNGVVRVLNPIKHHMEVRRIDGSILYSGAWELDSLRELLSGAETEYYINNGSMYGTENELLVSLDLWEKNGRRHCCCLAKWDLTEDMPQAIVLACDPRK